MPKLHKMDKHKKREYLKMEIDVVASGIINDLFLQS